ncbi:hypothetical protein L2E82_06263 [Cichorium intybus]|uniref:Uncharacterized protein n=1 Tax=Cichorium intybus TaxID=13427 RepID=A0ACB9HAV6_CICIN|nr:hypothetical protein L2E82_06263 [Cichorium intybus]
MLLFNTIITILTIMWGNKWLASSLRFMVGGGCDGEQDSMVKRTPIYEAKQEMLKRTDSASLIVAQYSECPERKYVLTKRKIRGAAKEG